MKDKAHKKAERQDKELSREMEMMTIEVPTGRRESMAPTGAPAKPFSEMVGMPQAGGANQGGFSGTLSAAR